MEDVTRSTPPSELALNVGRAFRRRCRLALQFTAQFFKGSQQPFPEYIYTTEYLVPFRLIEGVQIAESGAVFSPSLKVSESYSKRVLPLLCLI